MCSNSSQTPMLGTVITPILQMRKLRFKVIEKYIQSHIVSSIVDI